MDFSKFKTADWLVIAGGAVVLVAGFLNWFEAKVDGLPGASASSNAFDYTFTGLIPWLLIVGAAVVTFLRAGDVIKGGSAPWPLIVLGMTALGALLIVLRVLIGEDSVEGVSINRAGGLWISALGAIAAAAGGVMGFQAAGGKVRDLTDLQKIRDAFKKD